MTSHPSLAVVRHLLYNNNPFYVISALLVLCGVWRSVAGVETLAAGWPMLGMLSGYVVLLAGAAWAIIRWGGVWQDARTLLVVIVLLLAALSMSFDAIAVTDPPAAMRLLAVGLAIAIGVSETTLRALRIRLSWFYRGPNYATLLLLFAYPAWLGELLQREHHSLRAASLMLFPVLGSAVLLSLLPAARWGRTRKWATGTPWPWPLFPWTMFFFLAIALGVRSYSLAFAFESGAGGESGFRWFWLTPLVIACSLLLLEMGLSAGHRLTQRIALGTPLVSAPLAMLGPAQNATQAEFAALLETWLAGPAVLSAAALILFYLWAWLREVKVAEAGLMAAVACAAVVDSATVDVRTMSPVNPTPLGVILIVQLILAVRNGASWRMLAASGMAILAGALTMHDTALVRSGFLPLHALVLAALAVGLSFDDRLARRLRAAAPYLLPGLALLAVVAYPAIFPHTPAAWSLTYLVGLAILAILHWRRTPEEAQLAAMLANVSLIALAGVRAGFAQLDNTPFAAGRPWLAAGLVCLAAGLAISLAKGGVLKTAWLALADWSRRQSPA
jgi:uncharacterized membrane protein YozB (DUF420 family)